MLSYNERKVFAAQLNQIIGSVLVKNGVMAFFIENKTYHVFHWTGNTKVRQFLQNMEEHDGVSFSFIAVVLTDLKV